MHKYKIRKTKWKRKEIEEGKHKTNEFVYTLNNTSKNELMEVIQMVLNQYLKYQNPAFDIYSATDRKQCIDYIKYCITFKKNSENEVYSCLVESLVHGLLDYFVNQDAEDEEEYKSIFAKDVIENIQIQNKLRGNI